MSQVPISERRTVLRDAATGAGDIGPERMQLYMDGDKLMAQKYGGTAVLVADLASGSTTPVGAVNAYAGDTAPAGWLLCNGDAVTNGSGTVQSQTADFSDLYALLSTTYGSAGTLPDLAGRVISQENGTYARGVTGGAVDVTLATANIPAHNHGLSATINSTVSDNSTADDYGTPWSNDDMQVPDTTLNNLDVSWRKAEYWGGGHANNAKSYEDYDGRDYFDMRADKDWNHYFEVSTAFADNSTTADAQGNGSSGVDNVDVRQPTLYMNYIIKF